MQGIVNLGFRSKSSHSCRISLALSQKGDFRRLAKMLGKAKTYFVVRTGHILVGLILKGM